MTEIKFPEYGPGYRQYLDNSTLASNTIVKRKGCVNEFIEYCQENKLTIDTDEFYPSVDAIRSYFEDEEINIHGTKVSAIRDFLEYIAKQVDSRTEDKIKDIKEKISMAEIQGKNNTDIGEMNKEKIENKLLKPDEIKAAKEMGSDKAELVIDILMDTAARPGELAAMNPEKIDFDECSFQIDETWSDGESFVQKGPKHDSYRTVKISRRNIERLRNYIEKNGFEDDEYLFDYRSDIYRPIKDAYTHAQVRMEEGTTNVTPHWHRHTKCTELANNSNNSIKKVRDYMGHKDLKITQTYLHVDQTQVVDVEI